MPNTPMVTPRFQNAVAKITGALQQRVIPPNRQFSQINIPMAACEAKPYNSESIPAGRSRPNVSQATLENNPGLCILMDAIRLRKVPIASQTAALPNKSKRGPLHETSISNGEYGFSAGTT